MFRRLLTLISRLALTILPLSGSKPIAAASEKAGQSGFFSKIQFIVPVLICIYTADTCQHWNLEFFNFQVFIKISFLGRLLDAVDDLFCDIFLQFLALGVVLAQLGSLVQIVSYFVRPPRDILSTSVTHIQLSILDSVDRIVNLSLILQSLSSFILHMVSEEEVQQLLGVESTIVQSDVEISDGELVITSGQEECSSPS